MSAGARSGRAQPWWRRRLGVQARSALAATIIVAVALGIAAVAFVLLLQRSLVAGIDTALTARAQEIATAIGVSGGDDHDLEDLNAAIAAAARQRMVVQVMSAQGGVVASSPDIEGESPLFTASPLPGDSVRSEATLPLEDDDDFRVLSLGVQSGRKTYTVHVAQALEPVSDSLTAVASLLTVGFPLLLGVVGVATFWFVGRSLRPVAAIRAKVAEIGGQELAARVPVPAARDEVARLAVTMNAMLDRLEASQRSQRRFVADASHELRSPIATIRASVEVALAHPGLTDNRAVAEAILSETERVERLVNDLLLLARVDESGLHLDRCDVDLDDLLAAEKARLRAATQLTVTARIDAVRVSGDPHKLAQLLRNLTDNAARHATAAIRLALYREGAFAVIEIADDGPGIPSSQRDHVFDRFVRLDESRERARGGAGLGLSIVREIVVAHQGTATIDDCAPGAMVRVLLPLQPQGKPI